MSNLEQASLCLSLGNNIRLWKAKEIEDFLLINLIEIGN